MNVVCHVDDCGFWKEPGFCTQKTLVIRPDGRCGYVINRHGDINIHYTQKVDDNLKEELVFSK